MDAAAKKAIETDRLVDITTIGRKTGNAHRKEVRLRQLDGQLYLSNNPGTRDWAANLFANPEFTYHLKESVQRDLHARASIVRDPAEKRASSIASSRRRTRSTRWTPASPAAASSASTSSSRDIPLSIDPAHVSVPIACNS